ncbi:hypothetical protein FGB62_207g07 [Gracilaria domingensis]|nr:hypothetical protein FGB62_207g07 [Gracilaria domingensis]
MAHWLTRVALLCALLLICDNARVRRIPGSKLERDIKAGSSNAPHVQRSPRSGASCSSSRPCSGEGCICWEDDVCRNNDVFADNVRECQECVVDDDCTGTSYCESYWAGDVEGMWCSDCGRAAMNTAALKCMTPCNNSQPGNQECQEVDCYDGVMGSSVGYDVVYGGDCVCRCCNGQTPDCVSDYDSGAMMIMTVVRSRCECVGRSSETNGFIMTDSDNAAESLVADCVETAWLKKNGFAHGILKERGVSKVWCIPGLPCATEGHLLAECDAHGACELVPYSQAFAFRGLVVGASTPPKGGDEPSSD